MAQNQKLRWGRILVAIFVAELLPILLLVVTVMVYALASDQTRPDSMKPEEFAPIAGNWVGPIGGFLATLSLSWWVARVVPAQAMSHGLAVGIGTALLDFSLAVLIGAAVPLLLVVSNCGRILAGFLGGLAARKKGSEVLAD